ncbi:uncharacterized protein DS421_15g499970 [Arachis hypogaea]|nr:uncharacterized protein DS421_15g499970 [Arachis hypogaea]
MNPTLAASSGSRGVSVFMVMVATVIMFWYDIVQQKEIVLLHKKENFKLRQR